MLKSLGGYPSEETINKMMIEYDDDGNEVIDFDEFIKMIVKVEVTNYSQLLSGTYFYLDHSSQN